MASASDARSQFAAEVGYAIDNRNELARSAFDYVKSVDYGLLGENLAIGGVEFIATLGAGKLAVQGGKSGLALSERIVSRFGGADVSSFGYSTLDAMEATGRLGGQIYDSRKLQQFGDYLQRRGIALKVGDEFVPLGKAGGFDAVEGELSVVIGQSRKSCRRNTACLRCGKVESGAAEGR